MDWLAAWLGEAWWRQWWAWGIFAALFGILELLAPGYIFLGFAVGAGTMAALFLVGEPITGWMPEAFSALLVMFAVLSILAWVAMRRAMGVRNGQTRIYRHDINEE